MKIKRKKGLEGEVCRRGRDVDDRTGVWEGCGGPQGRSRGGVRIFTDGLL